MAKKVILTGAFGNVGAHVLQNLVEQGHDVVCFDMQSESTSKKQAISAGKYRFKTVWGNLTDEAQVKQLIADERPDAIIHVAAVIAPVAFVVPDLAHDVNVNGTRYLIEAAQALATEPHFVFISSYSVHGSRNGLKPLEPYTGDTPTKPGDNYGLHKVIGENMLKDSGLPFTILRLCAVMSVDDGWGSGLAFRKFMFVIPFDQREHGCDVRDLGLAIANAISAPVKGRTFDLGGSDDWRMSARELRIKMLDAQGIRMLPEKAFKAVSKDNDDGWYFEDYIDTRESQELLQYQRHTVDDYFADIRVNGAKRLLFQLITPLIHREMLKHSIYINKSSNLDDRPIWEVIKELFGITDDAMRE